jgi:hypothetical protein
MKKLAIGCGLVLVLVFVVVVGAGIYGMMKVRSAVVQFAELGQIPDIERDVRAQAPFTPPASGELTSSQVDRLMRVQKRVRDQLGANAAQFERTYQSLLAKKEASVTDAPALISAYRDLAKMFIDAKRAQVAALNDAGLSLGEYRWIRSAVYQAIGAPFMEMDFAQIASSMKAGNDPAAPARLEGAFKGAAPPPNVKLVEPFKKQLEDNLGLASFGL